MLNILEREQLQDHPTTCKQDMRIETTDKEFAVFVSSKLHLVKDEKNLIRLFYERIPYENRYNTFIYRLK